MSPWSLQPSVGVDDPEPDRAKRVEELWAKEIADVVDASGGRLSPSSPSQARVGFAGISVGASALSDGRAASALDAAADQDCLVFVHPEAGGPQSETHPSWWTWTVGYTAQMQEAYLSWLDSGRDRWPAVPVVFAILAGGAPFQLERLSHRGVDVRSSLDPNTFLDVATYGRRAIELVIETFGVGQLVYGSDMPVVDPRPTLSAVRGFGDSVAQILQIDTPTALLP
jgi:predicted TIM-barrel fold metal-dependent hydrolase